MQNSSRGIDTTPLVPKPLAGDLLDVVSQLGADERRVLGLLARRLLAGQAAYGRLDLARDRRDWRAERSFEIQDLLIYSAFETLKSELGADAP